MVKREESAWSAIFGPLGAILGVPVTVTFKELVLEADEKNSWIARFMGKADNKTTTGDTPVKQSPPASVKE